MILTKAKFHILPPLVDGETGTLWGNPADVTTGVKLIFTGGHISFTFAFKGPNVISGLHKCNYSLTRGKELGAAAR